MNIKAAQPHSKAGPLYIIPSTQVQLGSWDKDPSDSWTVSIAHVGKLCSAGLLILDIISMMLLFRLKMF